MISCVRAEALAADRGGRRLFDGVSFVARAGSALCVTGANGVGKTSLLRILAGLSPPAAGRLVFEGPASELDSEDARAAGLHLLGHKDGLTGSRRVSEELDFWSRWWGAAPGAVAAAAHALALDRLLALPVSALSAGQRRRLALARLIAAPRALWLLDEPLAPLDAASRTAFAGLMRGHLDRGGIIIAATHDPLPIPSDSLEIAAR